MGRAAVLARRRRTTAGRVFTLGGRRPLDPNEPVVHVSHYEADAFARWCGARLPTEFEWEHAVGRTALDRSASRRRTARRPLHPAPAAADRDAQAFGDVWQWTASAYLPYPRFAPAAGAVGEYNGKFMSGQMVLRGGACITPAGHTRVDLPQLLPARQPLDVRRRPPRGRRVTRPTSARTPMTTTDVDAARRRPSHGDDLRAALRSDADRGLRSTPRTSRRSGSTTTAARSSSTTSRACPSTTPPGASGRSSTSARAEIAAVTQRRHARRARLGHVREDAHPARRAARRGHAHALRAVRRERADAARRGRRDRTASTRASHVHAVVGDFEHSSRHDSRRRPPARRVPRRHDRQPRCRDARVEFLARSRTGSAPTTTCCSALDLVKDVDRLEAAYDDAQGVTAEFNKNVLR